MSGKMRKRLRLCFLVLADMLSIIAAQFLALFLRYELSFRAMTAENHWGHILRFMPVSVLLAPLVFALTGLYRNLWVVVGMWDVLKVGMSSVVISVVQYFIMELMNFTVPRSFPIIEIILLSLFVVGVRLILLWVRHVIQRKERTLYRRRTMLIGGGNAGTIMLNEFKNSRDSQNKVVCIIDDDPAKEGFRIDGVPVVGGRGHIMEAARYYNVDEIVFAVPSMQSIDRREVLGLCQKTGLPVKILPGIAQIANGDVTVNRLRKVEIEDLLGRESVQVNMEEIGGHIRGKTILVTGGGGSIGSELCRQIAAAGPGRLIILDIYENNAYAIQQELLRKYPGLPLSVVIGSVRDTERVEQVFETYKPQIVYHAAAHKHVPLMEASPCEAIKNNVFGTYHVAAAADRHEVETFVMISTDKAVNPTNVMGASKRICEMIVQTFARSSKKTRFVAVRFGNVLGSNGSVIPLFRKQIEEGGPVTVTHKDIIRYFMTIPEAVSLVMQAGVYAKGGEIFVLDMGEPVRIDDLARNMIRLSGFEPDVDIKIVYTGLRPGEKLYEELLMSEEGMDKTDNKLIFIGHPADFPGETLYTSLERLRKLADENDAEGVIEEIKALVSTYHPQR